MEDVNLQRDNIAQHHVLYSLKSKPRNFENNTEVQIKNYQRIQWIQRMNIYQIIHNCYEYNVVIIAGLTQGFVNESKLNG